MVARTRSAVKVSAWVEPDGWGGCFVGGGRVFLSFDKVGVGDRMGILYRCSIAMPRDAAEADLDAHLLGSTWIAQAHLAAWGGWDALKAFQAQLKS
jgi:hypothetical protein